MPYDDNRDPLRLLLVEDEPDTGALFALLLESLGHAVTWVQDGSEALKVVRDSDPDVALVDLGIPTLDGLQLARLLRAEGWARPLVAVTAYGDEQMHRLARQAGFDRYLVKPVGLPELRALLADLAQRAGGPSAVNGR